MPDGAEQLSSPYENNRLTGIGKSLLSGAVAGAVAKTTIAPLDRTKIFFQVSSTKGYSFKSALKFVRLTYHQHGFFALYRGNTATMARVVPYAALQFAAFEQYRHLFKVDEGKGTPYRRFFVGSLAACTATVLTYPLDTAKAMMSISTKHEYKSVTDVFVKTYNIGGIRLLYRGVYPTLLGVIPYAGTSFFTYETLKLFYKEHTGENHVSAFHRMIFGAFAGLLGQSGSYPLDIVRRRMQTGKVPSAQGPLKTMYQIYMNEGLKRGLYKGLSMNWVKGPIAVGVSFATYEGVRDFLKPYALQQTSNPESQSFNLDSHSNITP